MQDVKVQQGPDVGSDHESVVGKIKLKLKRLEKKGKIQPLNIDEIVEQYAEEVKNITKY